MKIAVILTGHMRCYQDAWEQMKRLGLNNCEYDVFIHTWSEIGYYTGKGYLQVDPLTRFVRLDDNDKGYSEIGGSIDDSDIRERYNPRVYHVEIFDAVKPKIEEISNRFTKAYTRPRNTVSQFYKISKGIETLVEWSKLTNTKYDLVIRTRPDLYLESKFPALDSFRPHVFYTNTGHNAVNKGIGDQLHIASFDNMVKFGDVFNRLNALYDELGVSCPHMFTETFLKRLGIPYFEIPNHIAQMKIMHSPYGPYQEPDGSGIYTPTN